jgi:hypothetical protein
MRKTALSARPARANMALPIPFISAVNLLRPEEPRGR